MLTRWAAFRSIPPKDTDPCSCYVENLKLVHDAVCFKSAASRHLVLYSNLTCGNISPELDHHKILHLLQHFSDARGLHLAVGLIKEDSERYDPEDQAGIDDVQDVPKQLAGDGKRAEAGWQAVDARVSVRYVYRKQKDSPNGESSARENDELREPGLILIFGMLISYEKVQSNPDRQQGKDDDDHNEDPIESRHDPALLALDLPHAINLSVLYSILAWLPGHWGH